jgi:hypothetical protein
MPKKIYKKNLVLTLQKKALHLLCLTDALTQQQQHREAAEDQKKREIPHYYCFERIGSVSTLET